MVDRQDKQVSENQKNQMSEAEKSYQLKLFSALNENAQKLPWKDTGEKTVHLRRDHLKFQGIVKIYATEFGESRVLAEQIAGQENAFQVIISSNDNKIHAAFPTEDFAKIIGFVQNTLVEEGRISEREIKGIFQAAEETTIKH